MTKKLIAEIADLAAAINPAYTNNKKRIGYARTSTSDQIAGLEAQVKQLNEVNCDLIFKEQVSAVSDEREQFKRAINSLGEGDTLVVTTMSRLVRRVKDLGEVKELIEARGASLEILDLKLDTSTAIGKMTLQIIAAVSEMERELMLERQRHGIEKAKVDGKYKGRKPTAMNKAGDIMELKKKGLNNDQIAKLTGIGIASVYRILKQLKQSQTV